MFQLAMVFTALLSSSNSNQCLPLPDAVTQLRPLPVERYRSLEPIEVPLQNVITATELAVEGTVHPIRTYLSDDECALYTDYAVTVTGVHRGAVAAASKPGDVPLMITLWGGQAEIDGTKVIVMDMELPLLRAGQRVLLLLSKAKIGSREVYQPVFGKGVFDLDDGAFTHFYGLGQPLYKVDKATLVKMLKGHPESPND